MASFPGMKILVAPDKFKGSLTAAGAADALIAGWREIFPDATFDRAPLADGGEGTAEVFSSCHGARRRQVTCPDALGRSRNAEYVWISEERLAVIEMSAASGLSQIPEAERNILRSSTFGTGLLLLDALSLSPTTIAMGLGGSATNDAGAGLASALGWTFLDRQGQPLVPLPENLGNIATITAPPSPPVTQILALCDVRNPLLGNRGCSKIYGPQKGASPDDVALLESHLRHFADVCEKTFGKSFRNTPGAGAAGGTGFGLLTFCGAKIVSGFDWVAERLCLETRLAACDLVLTGEGAIDSQTLEGKGPGALALLAKKHGKPCIAFAGRVQDGAGEIFSRCVPIGDPSIGLAENLSRGAHLLRAASSGMARSFKS